MKPYRIFLASSAELQNERLAFVAFIHDYNKELKKYKISLEVEWWEDMDDHFNTSNKQQDYNEALKECHFLVMLFWTKVGKYTLEEFNLGRKLFAEKGLPYVYCYEKKCSEDKEQQSKKDFLASINISGEEQFQTRFDDFTKVTGLFRKNFQRLLDDKNNQIIVPNTKPATLLSTKAADEPQGFLGREEELKTIREKLRNQGGKLMLINAEGGIGKTTLAAKYWNDSLHEYKYNAWLFCDGGIINALKELAPKLKLDLAGMDEQQQLNALRLALSEKQDDFLLVLDNANNEDDIKVFRQEFEGFHWHVLITSRCQGVLNKEQELPITHLPPPLAKELFERYYKKDTADFEHLLDRVLKSIQYHTLLTEVFAKNLGEAAEMGYMTLKTFLEKLENEGLHLGKNSFEIENNDWAEKRKAATTDEILDALYDFSKLSEEQRFLLVNIAFLPAEPYTLQFINSLLANETNRTDLDLRKTLKSLSKKGWIAQTENTYRLSPVVQDLLLHKNNTTLGIDAEDLLDRLNYILDADAYNLSNIDLIKARPFVKLIFQINKSLKDFPSSKIGDLNFVAGLFFVNVGEMTMALKVYNYYSSIYQKLVNLEPKNIAYKNSFAVSFAKIGNIYRDTGNFEKTFFYYKKYYSLQKTNLLEYPKVPEFKFGYSISLEKLGILLLLKGKFKIALKLLLKRNSIAKELVIENPKNLEYVNGLAISNDKLGEFFKLINNKKESKNYYLEYSKIKKQISLDYPDNLSFMFGYAISLKKLGHITNLLNEENPIDFFLESQELFEELNNKSPENLQFMSGLAGVFEELGSIYENHDNINMALELYEANNKLLKEITEKSPNSLIFKNNYGNSFNRLGNVNEKKNNSIQALNNYKQSCKIFKQIFDINPDNLYFKCGLAISLNKLGTFHLKKNELGQSLQYFMESRQHFAELWQATQGQIVEYAYYFALNTKYTTDIIKHLINQKQYPTEQEEDIKDGIKAMRQEGIQAVEALAAAGVLHEGQMWLVDELGDEGWCEF
jgi:tetratricopeptide (TPR) repeat protein